MKAFSALVLAVISFLHLSPLASAVETDANAATTQIVLKDLKYHDVKASHLLAFSAEIDDRPLYVESALLAVEFKTNSWQLVHVYRHPNENPAPWHISLVYDAPYAGYRDFHQRPTESEVEKFLRDTWWKFGASDGFRLLYGRVYSDNWRKALGYKPKHGYPKPQSNHALH